MQDGGYAENVMGIWNKRTAIPSLRYLRSSRRVCIQAASTFRRKNTRMCSGCGQHEDLATVQAWSQEEVDELITERLYFEEFRRTATHSEVYVALKKNYAIAIRNIKQGGTPSMKPKRELSDSDEATDSGTAKMQRTANVSYVLEELQFMSPPQLLKVNKNVAELLEKKFPWFVESKT